MHFLMRIPNFLPVPMQPLRGPVRPLVCCSGASAALVHVMPGLPRWSRSREPGFKRSTKLFPLGHPSPRDRRCGGGVSGQVCSQTWALQPQAQRLLMGKLLSPLGPQVSYQ